uniref:Fibronectin type-III domain-containing protein n=1 Tax=Cyanistes caeruleus TaxID=156563 RepID=A0A8C0ZK47_CYACU
IMRGVPVPTAKWVTDDTEIKPDGKYKIETDNYSTVLTIKDCVRKDTGEYLLTVSNAAGSKTVALHLTVLDVPVKANLVENREYFFRVCAENKIGPGPCIETKTPILAINPIDKPGEPENLHIAEKGKTFVYLKWRRPDYDGGSPNLSYHVERKLKDSDEWERVHKGSIKETHYMVDKCVENKIYQFRVQTKNEAGESNWVKTAEVVVKEDLQKPVLDLKLSGVLTVKAGFFGKKT